MLLTCLACAGGARAGFFDCNVIYDEFESLMNRQFLSEPGVYVAVTMDAFSGGEFRSSQRGVFHLYPNRANLGVAVVATNRNTRGKLLLDWEQPPVRGVAVLDIVDGVLYGRIEDGYAPHRLARTRVRSGFTLDLDSGRQTEVLRDRDGNPQITDEDADVLVSGNGQTLSIQAVNEARLWFPLESMCVELE